MTKETEHKRIITERFGHQGDSDSSFTRKARLLQSISVAAMSPAQIF